jgi:hypothetical protein
MRLTQFGSYTLPLYNKRDVLGGGPSDGALVGTVTGAYDGYRDSDAPEGVADLTTSFEIIETTTAAMQTARDAIRALRGTKARLWAHMPDGTDRFVWARVARLRMEARREYVRVGSHAASMRRDGLPNPSQPAAAADEAVATC